MTSSGYPILGGSHFSVTEGFCLSAAAVRFWTVRAVERDYTIFLSFSFFLYICTCTSKHAQKPEYRVWMVKATQCKLNTEFTQCYFIIMTYGSTPYVGMAPEKNGGHIISAQNDTLKMSALDLSRASMSHISHYRLLLWAMGLLTLLEIIAKVPDRQVAETSILWLLSFFFDLSV